MDSFSANKVHDDLLDCRNANWDADADDDDEGRNDEVYVVHSLWSLINSQIGRILQKKKQNLDFVFGCRANWWFFCCAAPFFWKRSFHFSLIIRHVVIISRGHNNSATTTTATTTTTEGMNKKIAVISGQGSVWPNFSCSSSSLLLHSISDVKLCTSHFFYHPHSRPLCVLDDKGECANLLTTCSALNVSSAASEELLLQRNWILCEYQMKFIVC